MPVGRLVYWNAERGFGFLRDDAAPGASTFVHVSELEKAGVHLVSKGQVFAYRVGADHRSGRERAVDLEPVETFDLAAEVERQIG